MEAGLNTRKVTKIWSRNMYGRVRVRANVKINYASAVRAIMHRKAASVNRDKVGGNPPCFCTKNIDSTFKRIPSKILIMEVDRVHFKQLLLK